MYNLPKKFNFSISFYKNNFVYNLGEKNYVYKFFFFLLKNPIVFITIYILSIVALGERRANNSVSFLKLEISLTLHSDIYVIIDFFANLKTLPTYITVGFRYDQPQEG